MRRCICVILVGLSLKVLALPEGMSFVGLENNEWKAFVVDKKGTARPVKNVSNPRQITWSAQASRLVYLDASGAVIALDLGSSKKTELVGANYRDSFTQLRFAPAGSALWAVRLKDRQSETASLEVYDEKRKEFVIAHPQRGANFDPAILDSTLLYTHVSCVVGCGQIMQEVWIKNTTTGIAQQLTLMNSLSRHPVLDLRQQRVVFSNNQNGNYHLWSMPLSGGKVSPQELTSGDVTDVEPAIDKTGGLFWIRRVNGRGALMRLDKGVEKEIPVGVADIRDLEITF